MGRSESSKIRKYFRKIGDKQVCQLPSSTKKRKFEIVDTEDDDEYVIDDPSALEIIAPLETVESSSELQICGFSMMV